MKNFKFYSKLTEIKCNNPFINFKKLINYEKFNYSSKSFK